MSQPRPNWCAWLPSWLERHALWLVLVLVAVGSLRIASTYWVFSHTADEPGHMGVGVEYLDQGTYQFEAEHPPLARVFAAIGPYLLGMRYQGTEKGPIGAQTIEGLSILYHSKSYDQTLAMARMGMLPFFWAGCFVVFWWGKHYFGKATGVAALFLFSFLPVILGHAGLATTDMALTAFCGAAFLGGLIWVQEPTRRHAVWFGVGTGLAMLSKFSILAFLPAGVLVGLAWYLAAERPNLRWLLRAVWERVPTFLLAVLVACLVIWAGYRFSFGKVNFADIKLPAPEFYKGLQDVAAHNTRGHHNYLLGERSTGGFWCFYEVALAVKTPLAFLIFLGVGITLAWRKGKNFWAVWMPLSLVVGILLVGVFSRINIGIRHVMPIYVALTVVAAYGLMRWLSHAETRKLSRAGLVAAVLWLAASSALAHPDYFAYFNELAGSEPENILVDSDLDWGQDLKRAAKRLKELGAPEVSVVQAFPGNLNLHGLPPLRRMHAFVPNPGWSLLGCTAWKSNRLGLFEAYPGRVIWPDKIKPVERIGRGMLLYYVPPTDAGPTPPQ